MWVENWGLEHFWALDPHPDVIHASYSSGDPEKMIFVWGESALIWGRFGGLKSGFFGFLE